MNIEKITNTDVTILVNGIWYLIPWEILGEDTDIRREFDLYDFKNGDKAWKQLCDWITNDMAGELYSIRAHVALKADKYKPFKLYVDNNESQDIQNISGNNNHVFHWFNFKQTDTAEEFEAVTCNQHPFMAMNTMRIAHPGNRFILINYRNITEKEHQIFIDLHENVKNPKQPTELCIRPASRDIMNEYKTEKEKANS